MESGVWNFRIVENETRKRARTTEQGPPYHVSLLCLLRLCPVGSIQTSGIEKERPVHCCFSSNKQRRSVGSDRLGRRVRNRDRRRQQHTDAFEGLRATPQNERHKSNRRSDNSRTTVYRSSTYWSRPHFSPVTLQCSRGRAGYQLYDQLNEEEKFVALVGAGCTPVTEVVSEITRYVHLIQVRSSVTQMLLINT